MKYLYLIILMLATSIGYMAPANACEGLRAEFTERIEMPDYVDPSREYDCAGMLYLQEMSDEIDRIDKELEELQREAQGLRPA